MFFPLHLVLNAENTSSSNHTKYIRCGLLHIQLPLDVATFSYFSFCVQYGNDGHIEKQTQKGHR